MIDKTLDECVNLTAVLEPCLNTTLQDRTKQIFSCHLEGSTHPVALYDYTKHLGDLVMFIAFNAEYQLSNSEFDYGFKPHREIIVCDIKLSTGDVTDLDHGKAIGTFVGQLQEIMEWQSRL